MMNELIELVKKQPQIIYECTSPKNNGVEFSLHLLQCLGPAPFCEIYIARLWLNVYEGTAWHPEIYVDTALSQHVQQKTLASKMLERAIELSRFVESLINEFQDGNIEDLHGAFMDSFQDDAGFLMAMKQWNGRSAVNEPLH